MIFFYSYLYKDMVPKSKKGTKTSPIGKPWSKICFGPIKVKPTLIIRN